MSSAGLDRARDFQLGCALGVIGHQAGEQPVDDPAAVGVVGVGRDQRVLRLARIDDHHVVAKRAHPAAGQRCGSQQCSRRQNAKPMQSVLLRSAIHFQAWWSLNSPRVSVASYFLGEMMALAIFPVAGLILLIVGLGVRQRSSALGGPPPAYPCHLAPDPYGPLPGPSAPPTPPQYYPSPSRPAVGASR